MILGYEVTDDDWLWLMRAVAAEGPVSLDVARALVNLWARNRARGSSQTLAGLVRSYAQPVNPEWADGGSHDEQPGMVDAAEQRRTAVSTAIAFRPAVAAAVFQALTSPFASDVTDYAAPTLDASKKGYLPRSKAVKGRNRLWTRDASWKGYMVESMTNKEKASAIRQLARSLPKDEREKVTIVLGRLMEPGVVIGFENPLLKGVKVIRPGEPGYEEAKAQAAARGDVDSDLAVANALDGMYRAVSDRVKELGGAAVDAVKSAATPVVLWVAVAALLVWSLQKE